VNRTRPRPRLGVWQPRYCDAHGELVRIFRTVGWLPVDKGNNRAYHPSIKDEDEDDWLLRRLLAPSSFV
jgi:hypothetical protein